MDGRSTRQNSRARAITAWAVGLLALLSLAAVVPASPMDLLVLSMGVLAVVAGATALRTPRLPVAVRRPPHGRRPRTVPLLEGRVTDTKRSPLAPRAPGLV